MVEPTKSPRAHARHSPSSAHRWLRCPGSVALCDGLPDVSNEAARQGTFAHTLAAVALREGLDAEQLIGRTDGEFLFDAAYVEPMQVYLDAVREPLVHPDGTKEHAAGAWIEQRVRLDDLGAPEVWGTLDAATVFPRARLLAVRDLKYGAGVFVDPQDNPQILTYAAGALVSFGLSDKIDRVILDAVQPRHWQGQFNAPQEVTPADVMAFVGDVLVPGVARTRDPDAPLVAGPTQCQWCPAKTICPAFRSLALSAAKEVFAEPPMLPAIAGPVAVLAQDPPAALPPLRANPPAVSELSSARLAEILGAADALRKFVTRCEAEALARAMRGEPVPGYKLVEKIGNRKWTNDEPTTVALLESLGVDPFAAPKLITPAEADRRAKKLGRGILAPLAHRPRTGYDVVPLSDDRPAALPEVAADVFGSAPLPDDGDGVG